MKSLSIISLPLAACVAAGALSSCHTCRSVEVRTDTVAEIRTVAVHDTLRSQVDRLDSLTVRDSVAVVIKGDTVCVDRWHWRDRLVRDRSDRSESKVDTIWRDRVRTVHDTRVETVGLKPTLWQRLRLIGAGILAGLLVMYAAMRRV